MSCLHKSQMLHLDIKPNNILLQPNSKPLLLDFGAARILNGNGDGWSDRRQTLTPGFAPPEQYQKHVLPGSWCDIYSIAAASYYCIVGKPPAVTKGSTKPGRIDIKCFRKRYSVRLLEAINKALSLEPADRCASVDDFARAMLQGTEWSSLQDYERKEMAYYRTEQMPTYSYDEVSKLVA